MTLGRVVNAWETLNCEDLKILFDFLSAMEDLHPVEVALVEA